MTFSEEEAAKRLQQLDNTQVSVETTSKWFLSVKDMAKEAVKMWFKEFRRAPQKKKIAFLHLANDIIQSGILDAPQYGKFFEPVLPTAFKETAKIQRHSTRMAVAHLLIVWASRRVYSKSFLRQLRFICQRAVAEADAPGADDDTKKNIIATSPFAFSFSTVLANGGLLPQSGKPSSTTAHRKRRRSSKHATSLSVDPSPTIGLIPPLAGLKGSHGSLSDFREELARELQTESIPPPEIPELIELLEKFQQPNASGDAATRRAIAQFPPEVSDPNKARELLTSAAEPDRCELIGRIAACASKLRRYNESLEEESNERNKLYLKLRAYHELIKEKLKECDAEVKDLTAKHAHGIALQHELSNHMSNLPDLNFISDTTTGLDPLPTISDLFG